MISATGSRRASSRTALEHGVFGILPALLVGFLILHVMSTGLEAFDFRRDFFAAGLRTLNGTDPYSWTKVQIDAGISFPYPALAALLFALFAVFSIGTASAIFTVLCLLSPLVTLRLVGRDWRLYGVVMLWAPVFVGWQAANVSLLLMLGLAVVWRYRDRPWVAGLLTALLISIKPIALPLGLWLLVTRRYLAVGWSLLTGLLINVVAWSVVGWGGIGRWLHLVSVQGDVLYRRGYGVIALACDFGFSRHAGTLAEIGLGCLLGVACIWLGRRRDEVRAFGVAVLLMIVISPQVDSHYFVLLIVPLAVAHPRLHWSWLLPLVLWVCPANRAVEWQAVLWWLAGIILIGEIMRERVTDEPFRRGLVRGPSLSATA